MPVTNRPPHTPYEEAPVCQPGARALDGVWENLPRKHTKGCYRRAALVLVCSAADSLARGAGDKQAASHTLRRGAGVSADLLFFR